MENTVQLQIEDLLFPIQEMRTNQGHDVNGDRAGTRLQYGHQVQKMDGQPGRYALLVSVRTDNDTSQNAPYTFTVEAYAVVVVTGAADEAAEQALIVSNGFPIVMGAIRERVAHLTGRSPWGRFLINSILVNPAVTINYV